MGTTVLFKPTAIQKKALSLLKSGAKHILPLGGSRSGKTTVLVMAIIYRALRFAGSRHLICRYRAKDARSSVLQRRIDLRDKIPKAAYSFTKRQLEVLTLICNGFTTDEAGEMLHISVRTVENHKTDLYAVFHVRNERELIWVAYYMDSFKKDELCFYGGRWEIAPLPEKTQKWRPEGDRNKEV